MARLLATDNEDMATIAVLLQDALLRACDTDWDPKRRTLTFLVNRYRWEETEPKRGHCLVRLMGVMKAQRRCWPENRAAILELLHVEGDDEMVEILFAGGTAVRCRVECVDILMEDVGEPWATESRPLHEDDEELPGEEAAA